ncbi:MAG: sulfite exporter TauE/SafE family protein, partial [Bacillota bacterium]
ASLMGHKKQLLPYQLGRGISYIFLGFLGGSLGQFFLNSDFVVLRYVSAGLFSFILVLMGLKLLFPQFAKNKLPTNPAHFFVQKLSRFNGVFESGLLVGLLTALLPCGWLYTYVTASIATKNPFTGMMVMFLFWLGSLPALSVLPQMVKSTIRAGSQKQQRVAGGILIVAGFYSLISFLYFH